MTDTEKAEQAEIWNKARLLEWFATQGKIWANLRKAIKKSSKWLNKNKIITAAALFFYFSVIGFVYDVIYYQWGFGLDPVKYINVEDFVFSAAKHWDVALIGVFIMIGAYIILLSARRFVLAIAGIILWAIPEKMKTPDYPGKPELREVRFSSSQVKTGGVAGQADSATPVDLSVQAIANFFLNALTLVIYTGQALVVSFVKLVATGCNGLIRIYSLFALIMVKWLSTSARVLRTLVVVFVIFLAPIVIAPLAAFSLRSYDSDKTGEVCTRRPFECMKARHVGATRDYGFFAIPNEQGNKSNTAALGPDRSSVIVRVFDFFQQSLKDSLNITTERPVRNDKSIRAIPLSNIATFSLLGSGAKVTLLPGDIQSLKDAMDSNKKEILEKIGEIEEVVHEAKHETLYRLRAIEKSADRLAAGQGRMETALGKQAAHVDLKLAKNASAVAAVEKAVKTSGQANLDGIAKVGEAVKTSEQVILTRIGQFEHANPASWYDLVTRFIVIDRSKTPATTGRREAQSVFSVSGFDLGAESPPEKLESWLAGFGLAMKACAPNSPRIRIYGFASAEDLRRTLDSPRDLCRNMDDKRSDSDLNNCRLANLRAARAAVVISTAVEGKKMFTKDEVLKSMNERCRDGTDLATISNYMNIEPWCNVGDMQAARFSFDSVKLAAHSLNRSVRILIEEPRNCPGF